MSHMSALESVKILDQGYNRLLTAMATIANWVEANPSVDADCAVKAMTEIADGAMCEEVKRPGP